jgi:glycosyltransferase involved in cell wall biosynthesis
MESVNPTAPAQKSTEMKRELDIGFVTNPSLLESEISGGVQICSQEYMAVLRLLGKVTLHYSKPSRHPVDRLRRKIFNPPYLDHNPIREPALFKQIQTAQHDVIFVNHSGLTRFLPVIKQCCPESLLIALSHGNQTGDDLFESAHPEGRFHRHPKRAEQHLGGHLLWEAKTRISDADGVITMSNQEVVLESWLGSQTPFFFPRTLSPTPIPYAPEDKRVGFVGTLDHTPNRIALQRLFLQLKELGFVGEMRVVGGPIEAGRALCEPFTFVTYLGPLSEDGLIQEAGTWQLALNPVFWLSRGASMKLKTYLNWGLPTLSTQSGARGYVLPEGTSFLCEDDTASFARHIHELIQSPARLDETRSRLVAEDTPWPTPQTIARDLKAWLEKR